MSWLKSPWFLSLIFAIILAAALFFYRQVWGDVPTLIRALDHCDELFCDFTRQYYPTGQALFETGRPSNGYFYTSFFALFLAGFGQLPQETAVALWGVFQLVSLLLLLLPAFYFQQKNPFLAAGYIALVLFSMPVMHNLKWGQASIFITAAIFTSLFLHRKGRKTTAAVILALATAVKYYAIIFAFYYLLRKEWRTLLVLLISVIAFVIVVPILALGWETNWQFYQTVSERIAHARTSWILGDINSQYLANVVNRLFENVWQTSSNRGLWQVTGLALAGLGVIVSTLIVWQNEPEADLWQTAVLFLILPFITETTWPHYFVYLPFVQILLLEKLWHKGNQGVVWGILFWLPSVLATSMLFFAWVNDRRVYASYGTLFWANLLVFLPVVGFMFIEIRRRLGKSGFFRLNFQ